MISKWQRVVIVCRRYWPEDWPALGSASAKALRRKWIGREMRPLGLSSGFNQEVVSGVLECVFVCTAMWRRRWLAAAAVARDGGSRPDRWIERAEGVVEERTPFLLAPVSCTLWVPCTTPNAGGGTTPTWPRSGFDRRLPLPWRPCH